MNLAFILFKKPLLQDVDKDSMDEHLKSGTRDPPHLVVFKDEGNDEPRGIFIVGHGTYVKCSISADGEGNASLRGAFITLVATYFAFQLDYPKMYCGALGILQEHLLAAGEYTLWRSKSYKFFAPKVKRALKAIREASDEPSVEVPKDKGSPAIDSLMPM